MFLGFLEVIKVAAFFQKDKPGRLENTNQHKFKKYQ